MTFLNYAGEYQQCNEKMVRAYAVLNFRKDGFFDQATILDDEIGLIGYCQINSKYSELSNYDNRYEIAGQALVSA